LIVGARVAVSFGIVDVRCVSALFLVVVSVSSIVYG
jgi:hypothetical protein